MKSKYEISVWTDVYDKSLDQFVEQKEIIIGSDTMTSEARAREPKLVNNINGTNQFTFNLYYRYIDTRTGEEIENPYIPFLVNERKIKVQWKEDENHQPIWYDMLIKSIKEDQASRYITYTCEDCYITELSRTGFELEFATELENNIGTAQELVEKVIEDTDWQFDKTSDKIYQLTEEPVYEVTALTDFNAKECPLLDEDGINIVHDHKLLIYYSCAHSIEDLKTTCQFSYSGENIEQDQNDMLVIHDHCCIMNVLWHTDTANQSATAYVLDDNNSDVPINLFTINFAEGLSNTYRAERYVQSQQSVYSDILERYVNVFESKTEVDDQGNPKLIYGYETTEYNDALAAVNLITNPNNFKDLSGWTTADSSFQFKIYPPFDSTTSIANYTAKSYMRVQGGETYFNSGIQNNRSYISKGFIKGERYIFRIKAQTNSNLGTNDYINDTNIFTPIIAKRSSSEPTTLAFEIKNKEPVGNWIEYTMECIRSCPYDSLLTASDSCGIFLIVNTDSNNIYWFEELQFFREIFDSEHNRINPDNMDAQSVATVVWQYFAADQPAGTTKNTLKYDYTSTNEWDEVTPVYNHYEKYSAIEADNSNRFNILQSIAENFRCWIRFVVKHDSQGYILKDESNRPQKLIHLSQEAGQETGIGFIYGIDLKDVTRTLKSNQIATKTIVLQNENEFGTNGFCSIARSKENYTRENFIYNFDYYIQQGLLNGDVLNFDLYNNTSGLRYYHQLHTFNTNYANNLTELINKKTELTRQKATQQVYEQYLTAAENELGEIQESIMKLAGVNDWNAAMSYVNSHYNDTKVQSLVNDRTQVKTNINMYTNLKSGINGEGGIDASVKALETYVEELEEIQDGIISDLRALNKAFYSKYSRYIQEGTWSSEDYWNDDLYYLDALKVAYESARPQIQYEINVLRLSELDDYSSKIFRLGDISFIQDVKYFGYQKDGITPYKEKVMLSEITSYFDTPDKDTIKVQNYKTQFDDLFQRIAAATQSLEFSEGKYAKAASIVQSDGTIKSSVIQNTFNTNKDLIYGAQNESVSMDNTGITVVDNDNAANLLKITSGGVFVSADAGNTWKNAIRGDGINTELLTAGRINTEDITVYNGEYPSFRWDATGINAYNFNETTGVVNTLQFVRFDRFGLYGFKSDDQFVYNPVNEKDVWDHAVFGLTWKGFFLKDVTNGGSTEISTDHDIVIKGQNGDRVVIGRLNYDAAGVGSNYGIVVYDNNHKTVFKCDENSAEVCGWEFGTETANNQEYKYMKSSNNGSSIELRSNGTIGSFASESASVSENAYSVQLTTNLTAYDIQNHDTQVTIPSGSTIYVFSSFIGNLVTTRSDDANHKSSYDTTPETYPTPANIIQFKYNNGTTNHTYKTGTLSWNKTIKKHSYVTQTILTPGDNPNEYTKSYKTIYTYNFRIQASGMTIDYDDSLYARTRYIPAHDFKWAIYSEGNAIFHNVEADGGKIAGWWIDNEKIYQTTDGSKTGKIKTQLNSTGKATAKGIDYSIITDAVNAGIATLGEVLLKDGLINGINIQQVAQTANYAYNLASSAYSKADALSNHTHSITAVPDSTTVGTNNIVQYMAPPNKTGTPST